MKQRGKVLIAAPVHPVLAEGLEAAGYECLLQEKITQDMAESLLPDCVGVITSTRLQLDRALLEASPNLQWIGRMGSGMEVIDTLYAAERGIACYSSPEGNSNAVAEHALGMLLSLKKRILVSNEEIKKGLWIRDANRGTELEGKTIGIIGFGHTGRALACKLQSFDMRILAYDKFDNSNMPAYVMPCEDLSPLYEQADIISFHVPLNNDTVHYFDTDFLDRMQHPFILINTSRGAVVDSKSLLDGLYSGKVAGACLDVFEGEPLEKMSPELNELFMKIAALPQVIVTPHIAGYSFEALYKMSKLLLDKIVIAK